MSGRLRGSERGPFCHNIRLPRYSRLDGDGRGPRQTQLRCREGAMPAWQIQQWKNREGASRPAGGVAARPSLALSRYRDAWRERGRPPPPRVHCQRAASTLPAKPRAGGAKGTKPEGTFSRRTEPCSGGARPSRGEAAGRRAGRQRRYTCARGLPMPRCTGAPAGRPMRPAAHTLKSLRIHGLYR